MPKRDKPYQPSVLVTNPRGVMIFAVVVSAVLHGSLAVWAWDKPIVSGLESAASTIVPTNVKRATEDYFSLSTDRSRALDQDQGPTSEDLNERLLDEPPPPIVTDPLELDVELRPIEEPFEGMRGGLEIDLPAFELDDDVLAALDTRPPAELDFGNPGSGQGQGEEGRGDGTGPNDSGTIAGNALKEAGSAEIRLDVAGGGQPLVERPILDQVGGVGEVMPDLGPSLEAPPIDFVDIALADTTRIEVPENLDNDFAYRVTRFTPTDRRGNPTGEDSYVRVDITAQRSLRKLATMPKDVVFIIDTSSSVSQGWVDQIMAGVKASFVNFNENDRFNIVLFNEKVSVLSDRPLPATRQNIDQAGVFLDQARSVGYTDVNAAMRQLLVRDIDEQRVYDLILISDGLSTRGVVDTRDLINLITRDNDLAAGIYCVGVAREQNRELLNFLSYRNKGFSVYADDADEVSGKIQDLMSRLRYPIIKDMRLDIAGLDDDRVFPVNLPDIHQGQTVTVYGRYTRPDDFTMQISGQSAGQDVEFTFTRGLRFADQGDKDIAEGWAFWKLHDLYDQIIREGERPDLIQQVEQLRRKYGLKTLY
ncbi:MAG: VWA domain-containing protein [Planctomycetota bacterium]